MNDDIPRSKLHRTWIGGKTAARVGGGVIGYLAKRPFLDPRARQKAREELDTASAGVIFEALSLLRGTSLKIAQQLSLELELVPEALRNELAKSYHQVPPINRALVRQIVRRSLGVPPEEVFGSFEPEAFAAASLGQVHRATSPEGEALAVKIQYPGIAATIENDIDLVKTMLRPLRDYPLIRPAITEIRERLLEEVDYIREARHIAFFREHLTMPGLQVPSVRPDLSSTTVLSMSFEPGRPLDDWLADDPPQEARDAVAQKLNDFFLKSLYEHRVFHADPNPGNFLVTPATTIGLVDFGCVKHLPADFVAAYSRLPAAAAGRDRGTYFRTLKQLGILPEKVDPATEERFWQAAGKVAEWIGRLFTPEVFDFGAHPDVMAEGLAAFERMVRQRRHVRMNPDIVYLDRTRYGLLRLFTTMKARVRLRNDYEQ